MTINQFLNWMKPVDDMDYKICLVDFYDWKHGNVFVRSSRRNRMERIHSFSTWRFSGCEVRQTINN